MSVSSGVPLGCLLDPVFHDLIGFSWRCGGEIQVNVMARTDVQARLATNRRKSCPKLLSPSCGVGRFVSAIQTLAAFQRNGWGNSSFYDGLVGGGSPNPSSLALRGRQRSPRFQDSAKNFATVLSYQPHRYSTEFAYIFVPSKAKLWKICLSEMRNGREVHARPTSRVRGRSRSLLPIETSRETRRSDSTFLKGPPRPDISSTGRTAINHTRMEHFTTPYGIPRAWPPDSQPSFQVASYRSHVRRNIIATNLALIIRRNENEAQVAEQKTESSKGETFPSRPKVSLAS